MDLFDNGNRASPEALYVNDLAVGPGSTLDLNGFHLYYDGRYVNQGEVIGGEPIPEPASAALLTLTAAVALGWRRRGKVTSDKGGARARARRAKAGPPRR